MIYRQIIPWTRPDINEALKFKIRAKGIARLNVLKKNNSGRSNLTTTNRSGRFGGGFGLKSAKLGLLFAQQSNGGGEEVKIDQKLVEEGHQYLEALVEAIKFLNKEVRYETFSFHQNTLSLIENGAERIQSLGTSEEIKKRADYMKAIKNKEKELTTKELSDLADIFLKISDLTLENESAKYFSTVGQNDFRFVFK